MFIFATINGLGRRDKLKLFGRSFAINLLDCEIILIFRTCQGKL